MADIVVIGGGFAGLSAAVALADTGRRVTLLEARPMLGGRARSFPDPRSGELLDNGQHLFIGAYRETLRFLRRLGTSRHLVFQKRLSVLFVEPSGRRHRFRCPAGPPPWHWAAALATFSGLPWGDRLRAGRLLRGLRTTSGSDEDWETAAQWLTRMGQSAAARRNFWDPLVIATLNEDPERVSAAGLKGVLRALIQAPESEGRLGMSAVGLTELYGPPAAQIITQAGGAVRLNGSAAALETAGGRVTGVRLASGERLPAERVIAALPPSALKRLLPGPVAGLEPAVLERFGASPILSVNLWFDRPITDELFVGLIGNRLQWLFNKPALFAPAGISVGYVSGIISAAGPLFEMRNEALIAGVLEELRQVFPAAREAVLKRGQVVREREATVSLRPGMESLRPGPVSALPGLFLAGDWTATGLPATIESAVVSGRWAAAAVLKQLASGPSDG